MTAQNIFWQGLTNALCITAFYFSMEEGMILNPLRIFLDRTLKYQFIAKPLYQCTVCMSSWWSLWIWELQGHRLSYTLIWVILVTAGINVLFSYPLAEIVFKYQSSRIESKSEVEEWKNASNSFKEHQGNGYKK